MNIQIKSYVTDAVLFEHNSENNSIRLTLELAIKSGAYLRGAYLGGADLNGAYLGGADLTGAYLGGADLTGADLTGADLREADLRGAYLGETYLSCANLREAYLTGAYLKNREKLIGRRPIFQVGPIGSRGDHLTAYITDKGLRFDAGCQSQITRKVFEDRLNELHGENKHATEYRAALVLIDLHAELWTPKAEDPPL